MAKHTPAPWSCSAGISSDSHYMVFKEDGEYLTIDDSEHKANCLLIAAAPDLLTACKASHNAKTQAQLDEAVKMIGNAIAKAEGK